MNYVETPIDLKYGGFLKVFIWSYRLEVLIYFFYLKIYFICTLVSRLDQWTLEISLFQSPKKEIILTLSLRDKNQSSRSRENLGKKKWKLPCQTFLSLERSPAEFPKFKLFTRVILVLWNLDNNYLRRLCAPGYIKI